MWTWRIGTLTHNYFGQWTPGKDADTQSVLASAAPGLVPSGVLAAPTMLSLKVAADVVKVIALLAVLQLKSERRWNG